MIYVKSLKMHNMSPIINSGRKTGFLGLVCCAHAIQIIFKKLIKAPNAPLKYLCTYKLSQDRLEIFFGSIRAKGGFNNNPTALQHKTAYKQLLIHGEIKHLNNSGNCVSLDDINILNINKKDIRGLWLCWIESYFPCRSPRKSWLFNRQSTFGVFSWGYKIYRRLYSWKTKKANKMHWLHSGSSINGKGI